MSGMFICFNPEYFDCRAQEPTQTSKKDPLLSHITGKHRCEFKGWTGLSCPFLILPSVCGFLFLHVITALGWHFYNLGQPLRWGGWDCWLGLTTCIWGWHWHVWWQPQQNHVKSREGSFPQGNGALPWRREKEIVDRQTQMSSTTFPFSRENSLSSSPPKGCGYYMMSPDVSSS